jgi:hypothetical protein
MLVFHPSSVNFSDRLISQAQPAQKTCKVWNTSWPENSWQDPEPVIYYIVETFNHYESKQARIHQICFRIHSRVSAA